MSSKAWLMGSRSRDQFKFLHKRLLSNKFYALNSDLELIEKYPKPFIVARLDFKVKPDTISFTEAVAYNQLVNMPMPYRIPVFIIEAESNFTCEENDRKTIFELHNTHQFTIYRYIQADWKPEPPTVEKEQIYFGGWEILEWFEQKLREHRREQIEHFYSKTVPAKTNSTHTQRLSQ